MHVAIIMDGNGRWASQRGLPRSAGHLEGAKTVRRIVEAAARADVDTLTLYAFSSDNWQRPESEVSTLMKLFERYLHEETKRCLEQSIRLNVIGRRDRLGPSLLAAINDSERATEACAGMLLRIAVDYSSQQSIIAAARAGGAQWIDEEAFKLLLDQVNHAAVETENVDLLIRSGGEQRLSDFLLWECAYAELHFSEHYWPDFREADLKRALTEFGRRQRRFGKLPQTRVRA